MLDFSEAVGAELSVTVDVSCYTSFSGYHYRLMVHYGLDIVDYDFIGAFVDSYFDSAGSLLSGTDNEFVGESEADICDRS